MKILLRVYLGILHILYIIVICTQWIWWFIPLLFNKSPEEFINLIWNHIDNIDTIANC